MYTKTVIEYFGSISALARFLNIQGESIYGWKELIPKGRAYELLIKTGGKLALDESLYDKKKAA